MTPRPRWVFVLAGAATFIAAHAIEVAAQIGGRDPWFISALPSAALTAGAMVAVGVAAGLMTHGPFAEACLTAVLLASGALVPLVVTLFTHPNGPGNLFPIALVIAFAALMFSSFGGTALGWLLRRRP